MKKKPLNRITVYSFHLLFLAGIIFLNSCNGEKRLSKGELDLCSYVNSPIKKFVQDIKIKILDTLVSRQYTGNIASLRFPLKDGTTYEVIPDMRYNERLYIKLRDSFDIKLIQDSAIKCINHVRKAEMIKSCGTACGW